MNATTVPASLSEVYYFGLYEKLIYIGSTFWCVTIAYLIWKVAKKPLQHDERYQYRMQFLYNLLTACVFAVFVCISIPHGMTRIDTSYLSSAIAAFGIVFGYLCMLAINDCTRVHHSNEHYTAPVHMRENQEPLVDNKTMETNNYLEIDDLSRFPTLYTAGVDKYKDQQKRFMYFFILFVTIAYMTVMDGFFIIYWMDKSVDPTDRKWLMLVASIIIRTSYSVIIYGGMIHGMVHTTECDRYYKYLYSYPAFVIYYTVVLICSIIPLLLNMTPLESGFIIQQVPFTMCYGISSGVLLWFVTYYVWMQDETLVKKDITKRITLIVLVSLLIAICGLFV